MSMQINHIRSMLQISLPLLLLVSLAGLATWKSLQPASLSVANPLALHQTLTSLPAEFPSVRPIAVKRSGNDPFFRSPQVADESGTTIAEPAYLQEINLTTIARGKHGRYCIINGEIFHEKQVGKSFIVEKITEDQVAFQTSLENFVLYPGQKTAIQSGRLVPLEKVPAGAPVAFLEGPTSLYD